MDRIVDHVTFAGRNLEEFASAFESAGFSPHYGGAHDNDITHMYQIGFADHSYIELISKIEPSADSPWWDAQIDADVGPTAWAIPTSDIADESSRLRERGFLVDGPREYSRTRPDDTVVEWELTSVGDGPLGGVFPMLIMDHTPLERRVTVTENPDTTGIAGISDVVIGTDEFESLIERFEVFFEVGSPTIRVDEPFGARLADFEASPVVVAEPLESDSWLGERLDQYGTLPCAFLLEATSGQTVEEHFELQTTAGWGERLVHWIDVGVPGQLGVIE